MSRYPEYDEISALAEAAGLIVMGALEEDGRSLILLGAGPGFWDIFSTSPEASDGAADPVDRWSERVVDRLAALLDAEAIFPFGGPPYAPFIRWAVDSGRAWQSPVGMLVHDRVGMMISYRGALHLPRSIPLPAPISENPCLSCESRPCVSACPVGALSDMHGYRLDACHAYLDTGPGQRSCMTRGCAVRLACPVSAGAGRTAAQSALHMEAFHRR